LKKDGGMPSIAFDMTLAEPTA